jgi:hypothetical protein
VTQLLTEADAGGKTCPFMSGWGDNPILQCHGSKCACWSWVDREEGQIATEGTDRVEQMKEPEPREGHVWVRPMIHLQDLSWYLFKVIGPRRGKCGAAK